MLKRLAVLGLLALRADALRNVTTLVGGGGLTWSGSWNTPGSPLGCNGEQLKWSNTTGNYLSATFTGTAVYLQTTFAFDRGIVAIEIDGKADGSYNAWIDDPTKKLWECGTLYSKTGLSNSSHVLKATVAGAHNGSAKFEVMSLTYSVPEASDNPPSSTNPPSQTVQAETTPPAPSTTPPPSSSDPPTSASSSATQSSASARSSSQSSAPVVTSAAPASTGPANPSGNAADVSVDDPRIQWSPSSAWVDDSSDTSVSACASDTRVAKTPGATLTFPFKGTAIALHTVPSNSSGIYTVSIDGQNPQSQDGFAASSVLCSPQLKVVTSGLADTNHVLVITVMGASNAAGSTGGARFEIGGLTYYGQDAMSTVAYTSAPSSSNQTALIGGVVGGVVGALLIVGIIVFFYLRRRQNAQKASWITPSIVDPRNMSSIGGGVSNGGYGMVQAQSTGSFSMTPNRVFTDPQSGSVAFQAGSVAGQSHFEGDGLLYAHSTPSQSQRSVSPVPTSPASPAPYPYNNIFPFSSANTPTRPLSQALASSMGRSPSPTESSAPSIPPFDLEMLRSERIDRKDGSSFEPLRPASPPPAYVGNQQPQPSQSFMHMSTPQQTYQGEDTILH